MSARAALVTGGAKRVGRAIALDLAKRGIDIILHYNTSHKEAEKTYRDIRALGVDCLLAQADLSDATQWSVLVEGAFAQMPHCNILINNASTFGQEPFLQSSPESYRREFAVNFDAPVFLTQAFAKTMQGGVAINMIDSAIVQHTHSHFFYLLAKKALANFTRMAATDLGPEFRVCGVCPGYLMASEHWGEEYRKKLEQKIPLRSVATLEAVTHGVWSLVENQSITGQLLFIDGGARLI